MVSLLPPLVYHSSVTQLDDIWNGSDWKLPDGQVFIMDPLYVSASLTGKGAAPNYIGEIATISSIRQPLFRKPKNHEVVTLHPSNYGSHGVSGSLRWNGKAWGVYRTLPQQALDAQGVFELFDVDGIYDYFAQILGSLHAQQMQTTKEMLQFLDPTTIPQTFFHHLAETFGADGITTTDLTPNEFRAMLGGVIALHKDRGTPRSVVTATRNLGYIGRMLEVWVNPDDPATYEDVEVGGTPTNASYFPSSFLTIHLTDLQSGSITPNANEKERIAKYLKRNILPAHAQIKHFITA
jgi:hypothetical protein